VDEVRRCSAHLAHARGRDSSEAWAGTQVVAQKVEEPPDGHGMVDAGAADGRKARASAGRTAFHGTRGGHQGMVNILEVHKLHGTGTPDMMAAQQAQCLREEIHRLLWRRLGSTHPTTHLARCALKLPAALLAAAWVTDLEMLSPLLQSLSGIVVPLTGNVFLWTGNVFPLTGNVFPGTGIFSTKSVVPVTDVTGNVARLHGACGGVLSLSICLPVVAFGFSHV